METVEDDDGKGHDYVWTPSPHRTNSVDTGCWLEVPAQNSCSVPSPDLTAHMLLGVNRTVYLDIDPVVMATWGLTVTWPLSKASCQVATVTAVVPPPPYAV